MSTIEVVVLVTCNIIAPVALLFVGGALKFFVRRSQHGGVQHPAPRTFWEDIYLGPEFGLLSVTSAFAGLLELAADIFRCKVSNQAGALRLLFEVCYLAIAIAASARLLYQNVSLRRPAPGGQLYWERYWSIQVTGLIVVMIGFLGRAFLR